MRILAIETSCDETAAAVVEDGTHILSNVVVSQIDIHKAYGGVVPEIAARSHIESIIPVIRKALKDANCCNSDNIDGAGCHFDNSHSSQRVGSPACLVRSSENEPESCPNDTARTAPLSELQQLASIDAIAVTHTPGLNGSLLIGTLTARTLAHLSHKPLYPIHHIKSHIYANWLESTTLPEFPLIALVVSGGHTQLIYMEDHNKFEIIGTTLDDAVGEAFDKAAKILGLPYPGGPSIASAAKNSTLDNFDDYKLPIPKVAGLDFSFSGLKTALLRAVQKTAGVPISTPSSSLAPLLTNAQRNNFAHSFQKTAVQILVEKLTQAVQNYHPKSIVLGGGVSANTELRNVLIQKFGDPERAVSGGSRRGAPTKKSPLDSLGFFVGEEADRTRNTRDDEPNFFPQLYFPKTEFCVDNAAMVASAAYFSIKTGKIKPEDPLTLDVSPRSTLS